MSYEQPDYTVVHRDGDIEYRQYAPYLVSETVIESTGRFESAGNEGFRRLFRYISGNNEVSAKIAMTVPVEQSRGGEKIAMTVPVQQSGSEDGWRVAFMLPSKYTLETAPQPSDPRVTVREVPARLVAVLRFSGRWTDSNFSARRAELQSVLEADSVSTVGAYQSAMYNGPFTLPFLRRNEVMVEVDRLPAGAAERNESMAAAH